MGSRLPVVVTGGVATGKSTVLERFRHHGFRTASADAVVASVWADPETSNRLAAELGLESPINRDELRMRLADPDFRGRVAEAIHPLVVAKLLESGATVVEIPLLFESCMQGMAELILVTVARPETQLERLTRRLGDSKQAEALLKTQLRQSVRVAFATWVVDTENDLESTKRLVDEIVGSLPSGLADKGW